MGQPVPWEEAPRRAGDPARLVADASYARSVLGWTPSPVGAAAIVESAVRWHRDHPQGYSSR